jgi:hypothetical protein
MCRAYYWNSDGNYHGYGKIEIGIANMCNPNEEIDYFILGNDRSDYEDNGPSDYNTNWFFKNCKERTMYDNGECIQHIDSLFYHSSYGLFGLTYRTNQGSTGHVNA